MLYFIYIIKIKKYLIIKIKTILTCKLKHTVCQLPMFLKHILFMII